MKNENAKKLFCIATLYWVTVCLLTWSFLPNLPMVMNKNLIRCWLCSLCSFKIFQEGLCSRFTNISSLVHNRAIQLHKEMVRLNSETSHGIFEKWAKCHRERVLSPDPFLRLDLIVGLKPNKTIIIFNF